jgi:UDP-N-acetylmuramoylalanine--D-glutamate ligase
VKVLVYGLGRSGGAVARLLRRQDHEVWTYDAAAPQGDDLAALGCRRTDTPLDTPAELCVAAPGVPYEAPDLAALRARGLETIGEVEWVYRSVDAEIIGVTGTAGKTTTTRWLSHALTQAGLNAPAGGNIDPALAAVAEPGATLVAELSSFQLERCPTLKPSIAVILNLGTDHLDRHGSVTAYHAAKGQLIANLSASETFIYHQDDPILRAWAAPSPARCWGFSAYDETAAAHLAGDTLMLHGRPLLAADRLKLSGAHHLLNALAVALACAAIGLSRAAIRKGLESFTGVPGRYSLVLERAGICFIDDSIATRTLSVQAALSATPAPIVWLVGGQDKGADLGPLEPLVRERVLRCIGIGEAGKSFTERLSAWTETSYVATKDGETAMLEAVTQAAELLRVGGGTVLLAPLAASFDQFSDYRARARAFHRAARVAAPRLETPWTLS